MSDQVTTSMVQQYKRGWMTLVQQKGSRFRAAVREESLNGKFGYFDQIGAGTAVKRTARHGDTPYTPTPHGRRQVSMDDYEYNDFVDSQDLLRLINDPTSPYADAAANAMGRAMDDVIIAAATGTSKTGETGSTSVSFPSGSKVAVAASGLTLAKLLNAKEILDAYENDPDEERMIAFRAKDQTTLLNTTEIKSSDYNTVKALVQGKIDTFLGFKFIRTQRLITSTDGTSIACLAWRKSALLLAVGQDPKTRIGERPDKSYSTQVYNCMSIGGTRMEEEGVIEISVTA
jgi:hypothetical protein